MNTSLQTASVNFLYSVRSVILIKLAWLIFLPVLFTGSIFFEERLVLISGADFSVNSIFFVLCAALYSVSVDFKPSKLLLLLLFSAYLLCLLFFDLINTGNISGILKYVNGTCIGLLGGLIAFQLLVMDQKIFFVKSFVLSIIVLLICAIIVKLQTGFLVRPNPYFMHGAIVFGRIMGVGLFLVLMHNNKLNVQQKLMVAIFCAAVFWSMSKGPILSMFLAFCIYIALNIKAFISVRAIIWCTMMFTFLYMISQVVTIPVEFNRVFGFLFSDESRQVNLSGSVGIRQDIWNATLQSIAEHPLTGIGSSGWESNIGSQFGEFTYAHNLILEIYSDFGLLFGTPLILMLIIPLRFYKSQFYLAYCFLFSAQQVSGDIADARFLIMFGILIILSANISQKKKLFKFKSYER